MEFDYAAAKFKLEFERKYKMVRFQRNGRIEEKRSKYPYTTVKLLESRLGMPPLVTVEHTVGCLPVDAFSNEKGRIAALRGLMSKIHSKELRKLIWETYNKRKNQPVKETQTP